MFDQSSFTLTATLSIFPIQRATKTMQSTHSEAVMKDYSNNSDVNRLYRQVEGKLESIVEKLLISKVDDNDNVLESVHVMTERIFIACAMKITHNNISQASKLLGLNRNTLSKKLRQFDIKPTNVKTD